MPSTWVGVSKEILGYVEIQTPINEEYVAVKKIQKLLDEGNTPRQVALVWNTSLGGVEKPLEKKGKNKKGVHFDSIAYALKVTKAYATYEQK